MDKKGRWDHIKTNGQEEQIIQTIHHLLRIPETQSKSGNPLDPVQLGTPIPEYYLPHPIQRGTFSSTTGETISLLGHPGSRESSLLIPRLRKLRSDDASSLLYWPQILMPKTYLPPEDLDSSYVTPWSRFSVELSVGPSNVTSRPLCHKLAETAFMDYKDF